MGWGLRFLWELLRGFSPPWSTPSLEDHLESPGDLIQATGALRLKQLWQKRGEFKKLIAEYREQGVQVAEHPIVLETKHLRATLWRIGEREFIILGYLKDLSWQEELFARARREAAKNESPQRRFPPDVVESRGPSPDRQSVQGLGSTWTVVGNPFMRVELTDLGLLEVSLLWIEPRLPESVEEMRRPLLQLLGRLDG